MLNAKISVKYPENKGRKMPPDKIRSLKEGLKKLLCANRKTPSRVLPGPPETPPTLSAHTGNGTDTSSAATQDLAGDRAQSSFKRPTICYDCGKLFFSQGRLFRHQEMHRALEPYHCSECGEPFFSQTLLLRHQAIHPGLKSYNCTECGKLFISQELLLRHQETHRVQKPYNCTECGKSFKTKSRFHSHQSTHTGVKALECSVGGMRFIRRGLLLVHSRIHPGRKSIPIIISEPNKDVGLATSSNEQTYEVLGQNKMPKSIQQRTRQMAYAGDAMFSCSKCEKKFVSRHFLKIHRENIHTEMHTSLSKPKKKLPLKLKIVRRRVDGAVEPSATWQWTIVTDENTQGREKQ